MRLKVVLVFGVLTGCVALPFLIGASCPPPQNPAFFSIVPDNQNVTDLVVPACVQGFVCISLANQASIPVQMALYRHNGYDPNNIYGPAPSFACCDNPNSVTACACPCIGEETGNCRVNRVQLFTPINEDDFNGVKSITLAPTRSVLKRVRCNDIKSVGAAVAKVGVNVFTNPEDRNGPIYRGDPGGVPCGETVQFVATDVNESSAGSGLTDLTSLIIRVEFSNRANTQ